MQSIAFLLSRIDATWRSRPMRRLRADVASRAGIVIILLLSLLTLLVIIDEQFLHRRLMAQLLADPYEANLRSSLLPPSPAHPLGTDQLGRDVLARVIYATRTSITVGLLSIFYALPFGILFGLSAAYLGGVVDEILMRIMDIFLALPAIILALGLVGILGRGLGNIILGIAIVHVPVFARLMRGSALKVKQMDFVEAARATGESTFNILFSEMLPNCLTPVIIQASFSIAVAIVWESSISFLGLGVMPPVSSWGLMLSEGQGYLREAWWLSIFPGLVIMITTLGFNLFGNALRDALDPKYEVVQA